MKDSRSNPVKSSGAALSESRIQSFKSEAWVSARMARSYRRNVDRRVSQDVIALDSQVRLLSQTIPSRSKVLDIGCGTGALSVALAKLGFEVTGVDISEQMLNQLSRRSKGLNINVIQDDIFSLTAIKELYPAAISRWVIPTSTTGGDIDVCV